MVSDKTLKEIEKIEGQMRGLYDQILEKRPGHFRRRDIINSFFASLILGIVFIFKGALIEVSLGLGRVNIASIIILTLVVLTLQIYFVGYSRISVDERKKRHFGQFWAKRISTLYFISILVSVLLVYLYNINGMVGSGYSIFKVVVAMSMPCAVGAAIPSLLKQY